MIYICFCQKEKRFDSLQNSKGFIVKFLRYSISLIDTIPIYIGFFYPIYHGFSQCFSHLHILVIQICYISPAKRLSCSKVDGVNNFSFSIFKIVITILFNPNVIPTSMTWNPIQNNIHP